MSRFYFLSILLFFLFLGCVSFEITEEDCGGKKYSARNQICEDGVLKDLCGNGYYNSGEQFCYKSNIYDRCNGSYYDPSTNICVDSYVFSICGNDYYDYRIQFCRDGVVYDDCEGKHYNPLEQKCVGNIILLKCGDEHYYQTTQFCLKNVVYDKCDGKEYDPSIQKCVNNIIFPKCGDSHYNATTQFCLENTVYDKCKGAVYNVETYKCENNILLSKCGNDYYDSAISNKFCFDDNFYDKCGNKEYNPEIQFCDERDNNIYKKTIIGEQIWMAENLNFSANDTIGRCYNDVASNCVIYGRLYDYIEALKICPIGWHLPSYDEWNMLKSYVGNNVGTKLKANSYLWISGKETDDFGFNALPGGWFQMYELGNGVTNTDRFMDIKKIAAFWVDLPNPFFYYLSYNNTDLTLEYVLFPQNRASIRCLKD
ncbi:MAG: hypothetical protein FWC26_11690 [Fibromonadales bacterium]|nr:hypothetical protein [Fibromonadales bacterium]